MARIFIADIIISIWYKLFDYSFASISRLHIIYEFIIGNLLGGKKYGYLG